ncbi:penicillin-binding protein [Candidatus Aerophobetes bacterium]|uniref:Penicillin-binding protein n=1 Tax=Aerophobetes bacterium TaxID=2030807 RepID=A0A2A4X578_UNCAE|nr:MAG: penicillin-binding protein [Candidatus Aerophobetes bacterium]
METVNVHRQFHSRLAVIVAALLALFCFLVFQFFYVQIVEGKKWKKVALSQHQRSVKIPFKRGKIVGSVCSAYIQSEESRHPVFAFDILSYHLFMDTTRVPLSTHKEISSQLAMFFPGDSLAPFFMVNLAKQSRGRLLKKWVSEEKKRQVLHWWSNFRRLHKLPSNALFFNKDYRRTYPFGSLLGTVLSSVREDRDPKTKKHFPVGGLELHYDKVLQGSPGEKRQLKSLNNPLLVTEVLAHSKDGHDVVLHIDPYIQAICEDEIRKTCLQTGSKKATCIMMDPNSGAIVALAQYPFFDPTQYKSYFNKDKANLTRIEALSDPFEPGSTFKPITMAITLLANEELKQQGKSVLFNPLEMVKIGDGVFRGRKNRPIKDIGRHSFLNMYHAIEKSSNIYMAQIIEPMIEKLGKSWYKDQIEKFGFGSKTGVDFPSESKGFVPSLHGFYKGGAKHWSLSTPYSLGFGYNISVTAIQMLKAWSMLINGGFDVTPHIGSYIQKGMKKKSLEPSKKQEPVLPRHVCDKIKKALFFVCQSPRGTGRRAKLAGYSMGGKTSTTEKIINGAYAKSHNIATIMGFYPYENPKFLVFLSFDDPSSTYLEGIGSFRLGGRCSAPAFKKIFKRVADYVGLEPDDPGTLSTQDKRYRPMDPMLTDELRELNRLYKQWNY